MSKQPNKKEIKATVADPTKKNHPTKKKQAPNTKKGKGGKKNAPKKQSFLSNLTKIVIVFAKIGII